MVQVVAFSLLACGLCLGALHATRAETSSARAQFSGAQVLTVKHDGLLDDLIQSTGLDVWTANQTHTELLVPGHMRYSLKKILKTYAIPFTVRIKDVQKMINTQEQADASRRSDISRSRGGRYFSLDIYHNLEAINAHLDDLAAQHNYVTVGEIGRTHEGRPIKYIKISSGKPNAKAFFIEGGIHAREWVSPATVLYIIHQLTENRWTQPKDIQEMDYYIIVNMNPDGYAYTHKSNRLWRKNRSKHGSCYGSDLNRNFGYKWGGKGTSDNPCSETFRGTGPFSEMETKALAIFLKTIKNLKGYITYHSFSQLIMVPYSHDYNSRSPDYDELMNVGNRAAQAIRQSGGTIYRVGNTAEIIYPAAGGSFDWVKAETGAKYTYAFELRDTGKYGFLLPTTQILPTATEAYEAFKVIATAAAQA